jgi:AcrR family transcriptional regulator
MSIGQIDRRAQRTRTLLKQALIHLMSRADFASISVASICRQAGTGRSTFYTHFPDKEALKKSVIDAEMRTISPVVPDNAAAGGDHLFAFSLPILKLAQTRRKMHGAVSENGPGYRPSQR